MKDMIDYLTTLPLVPTASLAVGQLFWANHIYEVIEIDNRGYSRARQWRKEESTDVALIPHSRLAERLPVVEHGRLLPHYTTRDALLKDGQPVLYVFPEEQIALDAAYLDVALCGKQTSLYVRRKDHHPALEATNGMAVIREYYYMRTRHGLETNLPDIKQKSQLKLVPHREGPLYWRLLPSWNEVPYDSQQTIAIRPVRNVAEDTSPSVRSDEDTLPNISIPE
jgi:hypothetical protein